MTVPPPLTLHRPRAKRLTPPSAVCTVGWYMNTTAHDTPPPSAGPTPVLSLGRYTLGRYDKFGAFEFSDGRLGATGKGPIRAFIRWLRWRRDYHSKPPGYWAQ